MVMAGKNHHLQSRTTLSAGVQVGLALTGPVIGALIISTLSSSLAEGANPAPVLGALGLLGWLLGLALYGLPALGLRGGRPLFAGIGFATLGWLAFLLLRGFLIPIQPEPAGSARAFIYYLLFEAFAVQIWTFGLLFRSVAGWRGPLTAAIVSGVLFGATAVLLFQDVYAVTPITLIYYTVWGIFYGIIRLRTGSVLGPIIIQALQSFTAWVALGGLPAGTAVATLQWVYSGTILLYALFIWRLWPKVESDYRV